MRCMRFAPTALALVAVLALPGVLHADVIHLTNGNTLQVDGWRDVGDAIEFMMGGGVVRIAKSEIRKIDGKPTRGDFLMYSSGVSTAVGPLDQAGAVSQMTGVLKEGEGLFAETALGRSEKALAFRRLVDQWRAFEVPEPLRDVRTRGETALQMAVDAYNADEDAPDAKERVDAAKTELAAVQDALKKLGPAAGGGQG